MEAKCPNCEQVVKVYQVILTNQKLFGNHMDPSVGLPCRAYMTPVPPTVIVHV